MIPDEAITSALDAFWADEYALPTTSMRHALEAAAPYIESAMLSDGWQEPEKPYIDDRSQA